MTRYQKPGAHWSPAEELFLAENWEYMTDQQIADQLGRTPGGVKDKRAIMGFKRMANNLERHRRCATYGSKKEKSPLNEKWVGDKWMRITASRLT